MLFNDLPCWLHVVPTLDANVRRDEKGKEKKTIGGGPSSLSFITRSPISYHEGGRPIPTLRLRIREAQPSVPAHRQRSCIYPPRPQIPSTSPIGVPQLSPLHSSFAPFPSISCWSIRRPKSLCCVIRYHLARTH